MDESWKKLGLELNRKQIPKEVEAKFWEKGDAGFDFLVKEAASNKRSDREVSNCLYLMSSLTRQHCTGRRNELIDLCFKMIEDERIGVRSESLKILATSFLLSNRFPELEINMPAKEELRKKFSDAKSKGLFPSDMDSYADNFIAKDLL